MDQPIDILNELQVISPGMARISRQLPYEAPAGYFDTLATRIMERIKAEEAVLPPVLQTITATPYKVPAGYFEGLPQEILQRVKVADKALSPGEELEMLSPLLSNLDKKLPFEAPAGYFTDLTEHVVSGAKAIDFVNEELENLSPVMTALKNKQVYEVPAGYFEGLPGQVLNQVKKAAAPARVVPIGIRRKMMRYATAAAVVGIVGMAAWWFTGKPGSSSLPDPVAAKVDKISEEELQSYLEDQSALVLPVDQLASNSRPEPETGDMTDLLQNVSDEEIQKYLEQHLLTKHTATN